MRGLYQRHRKWWYRFTWRGGRHFLALGTEDEAEAIIKARQIQEAPDAWLTGDSEISTLLDDYLREKTLAGISENWRTSQETVLKRFFEEDGISRPRDLTVARIRKWVHHHFKRNENTGVQYLAVLSRFCRWLVEERRLLKNPCAEIPKLRPKPRVRRRFLSRAECRKLLDACDDHDLKLCLYMAMHAGLRKGECLAARGSWFDLKTKVLHVTGDKDWHPKDRDNRSIPLTKEFAAYLTVHGLQEPYAVWPECPPSKWRYRTDFRKRFDRLVSGCGLTDVTFHDLRRTFASLHVSAGTSIYKVAKWLGDGVAVVEKHYGHLIPADDEINRAWKEKPKKRAVRKKTRIDAKAA